ncbi:MAG TPA: ABC transporter substrate-binding protein, partial [Dehalococcoidales bacterium]|nr:ABC transporter substrate-binding protein [Dehalococcoidales bacterium]
APGFNTINATKTLDSAGYRFDKTLKSRINPKTGQPLHMTVLTPLKDTSPVLWDIGYTLTYYINGLGIEADHVALPDYLFQLRAMETRDFDILVQDITLSKAPFGLYSLLYSSRDTDGTDAFSGIHDNNLDILLEQLWSSLDLPAAQKAAQDVQSKLADILPYVPVCSVPVFSAVNEQWVGFVNMPGTGISNLWSYESIKSTGKTTNNALRLIVSGEIDNLNPLTASTSGEWSILSQIFSPLFYSDPQSLQDTPVLAKKWDVQPWTTPSGSKGTKITFHLIDGVTWQDGVPFTAQDIKFGIDYIVSKQVPGFEDISNLVDNVQTPDNLTVEIYLKDSGYRYIYDFAWLTFLPQHIWQNVDDYHSFSPWNEINPQNKELTKLVGQGPFVLKPGNISNGIRLVKNESAVQVKP